jgi:hypothetical protein
MSNGGKGDNRRNRRRPFKRHERENIQPAFQGGRKADSPRTGGGPNGGGRFGDSRFAEDKKTEGSVERLRWLPPKLSTEPLPVPDCPYCGKPIKDLSLAFSDRNSDEVIHFDCMIDRISKGETLEQGDTVCYIGGGRFGVVHFGNPSKPQDFRIKRIYEWENKENRAEWRQVISDHFSVT